MRLPIVHVSTPHSQVPTSPRRQQHPPPLRASRPRLGSIHSRAERNPSPPPLTKHPPSNRAMRPVLRPSHRVRPSVRVVAPVVRGRLSVSTEVDRSRRRSVRAETCSNHFGLPYLRQCHFAGSHHLYPGDFPAGCASPLREGVRRNSRLTTRVQSWVALPRVSRRGCLSVSWEEK